MTTTRPENRAAEIDFTIMYATHRAFRRDLDRFEAAAELARSSGMYDATTRAAWENFKRQLHVHHTVEDAALWPPVLRAVAHRPEDLELMREMEAEHAQLEPLLDAADAALAGRSDDLAEPIRSLSHALGAHMAHEEAAALPLIQEVLTQQDWQAFRGAMARKQGPKGAAVYVPWVLDTMDDDSRQAFLGAMPGFVKVVNGVFWERAYQKRYIR